MSKQEQQKQEQKTRPEKPITPAYVPEGLRKTTGDVIGFHDMEDHGPIYGVPRAAKLSDSKIDPTKPSCFVIFQILEDKKLGPCKVFEGSGEEKVEFEAKPGDLVGVWTKPGMKPIFMACGRKVFMSYTGEKKLKGRPEAQSPMKMYDCHISDGPAKQIPLIEDNRERSKDAKTPWSKPEVVGGKPAREPGDDSEEDYGF